MSKTPHYTNIQDIPLWHQNLGNDCAICLQPLVDAEPSKIYPPTVLNVCIQWPKGCGHLFHSKCISEWIEKDTSCSYCRVKIDSNDQFRGLSWQCVNAKFHPKNGPLDQSVVDYFNRFTDPVAWKKRLKLEEEISKMWYQDKQNLSIK
jgi:hypothetical protein